MSCPEELLSVVILAGGKGSRLGGKDKGLLQLQGKPFIEYLLHAVRPVTKKIFINANRNAESYQQYGYPIIQDDIPDYAGPLAGMLAVLRIADTPYVLSLPCDAPLTSSVIIERFCQEHLKQQQLLYVASTIDGLQPVYAMVHVSLIDSLQQYLTDGHRKVQTWMKENNAVIISFEDKAELFLNINTETDLNSLC